MDKHNQAIRRQKSTNVLSVSDHFVGLAHKGLSRVSQGHIQSPVKYVKSSTICS